MSNVGRILAAVCLLGGSLSAAEAMPVGHAPQTPVQITPVADGCGWGAWRGPWGHCRNTPYQGRLPDGGWMEPVVGNGCPPGWWRGPWGHCRTTPYHGRLPGGGWQ